MSMRFSGAVRGMRARSPPAAVSRKERGDRRGAVHGWLRRHPKDRVVVQQRYEAVDVVTLKRHDLAAKQLAIGLLVGFLAGRGQRRGSRAPRQLARQLRALS